MTSYGTEVSWFIHVQPAVLQNRIPWNLKLFTFKIGRIRVLINFPTPDPFPEPHSKFLTQKLVFKAVLDPSGKHLSLNYIHCLPFFASPVLGSDPDQERCKKKVRSRIRNKSFTIHNTVQTCNVFPLKSSRWQSTGTVNSFATSSWSRGNGLDNWLRQS